MYCGVFEEDAKVDGQVIELGQKLFRDACGPELLHLEDKTSDAGPGRAIAPHFGLVRRRRPPDAAGPSPASDRAGCEWLLDQWADLRALLERGHALACTRQAQGRPPAGPASHRCASTVADVARIYLASHVLLNQEGEPFQEILNDAFPRRSVEIRALFEDAPLRRADTQRCRGGAGDVARDRRSSHRRAGR